MVSGFRMLLRWELLDTSKLSKRISRSIHFFTHWINISFFAITNSIFGQNLIFYPKFGASSPGSRHLTLTKLGKKILFSSGDYPFRDDFMRKIDCAHSHNLKTVEK
jgi:hypothetical protein